MPVQTGTTLPAKCAVGQMFFKSDAPKGANLYGCGSADTWSVLAPQDVEAGRLAIGGQLSDVNAYYTAAVAGNVQFGGEKVNSPDLEFISDDGDGGWPTIGLNAYNGESQYGYPWMYFFTSQGTAAQPKPIGNGQWLGSTVWGGQSSSGYRNGAEIRVLTTDDWATACTEAMGAWCDKTKMEFYTHGSGGGPTLTLNDDHSANIVGGLTVGGRLQARGGVQFAQSGAGAVMRTLEAKLMETVSVADFGADPTGTNDSTVAFTAAVNSGAKDVYIPAGTYRITQTLLISQEGLSFHGAGPGTGGGTCGSRLIWSGAPGGVVMEVLNTGWSRFSGFCVDGDGKAGVGIYVASNNGAATQRNLFEHISVQNVTGSPGYGWRVSDAGNYDVSQNEFDHITAYNCTRGLQQEGGQTASNNYHNWTISGMEGNQYGAYFEKGSIDFMDFTFLGPSSWLAHVYVSNDVLWLSGTNILHESNGAGSVYLFAPGNRWWPSTFQRLRILNHDSTHNPRLIDYEQGGQFTCSGCSFESYLGSTFVPATLYFHPSAGGDYTGMNWFGSKKDGTVTWDISGRMKWRTDDQNMNPDDKTGYELGATTAQDARLLINDPAPNISLKESDATADNRYWDIRADSNVFSLSTANDAYNSLSDALAVTRSGNQVIQTVFPNGKVGIGTTTPTRPLDITVAERWSGPLINNTAGNPYLYLRHGIGAAGHQMADLNSDGDNLYFEFMNDTATSASPSAAFTRGGTVKLGTTVSDGTMNSPVLFVGGYGSLFSGHVGVGTTSPSYPLDVNGAARASSIMTPGMVTAGSLTLNGGTGGPHQVLKQSTPNGPVTTGQMDFGDLSGALDLSGPQVANTLWNKTSVSPVISVANNTAEQNLMSIEIPAEQLNVAGKTLHAYAAFNHSTGSDASGTLTFRAKLCAVRGCGSGAAITLATWGSGANSGGATNAPDDLELWAAAATTGTGGTMEAHGTAKLALTADAAASPAVYLDANTDRSAPFDLTAPSYLQITVTCSTNGSTPSTQTIVTQRLLFAEIR